MWGFILAITELAQTAPSHLKLVLSSPHFFGWLRKSEVPELIPAPPKLGQLRLKAKKTAPAAILSFLALKKLIINTNLY